ncbi:hypothetical protein P7H22_12005 [Paenibacillus larvae]|nr:hypothetical protein [Paenibacillus larvae]MDT2240937.1 hypothetical protein [Paenibacillus larvae]
MGPLLFAPGISKVMERLGLSYTKPDLHARSSRSQKQRHFHRNDLS